MAVSVKPGQMHAVCIPVPKRSCAQLRLYSTLWSTTRARSCKGGKEVKSMPGSGRHYTHWHNGSPGQQGSGCMLRTQRADSMRPPVAAKQAGIHALPCACSARWSLVMLHLPETWLWPGERRKHALSRAQRCADIWVSLHHSDSAVLGSDIRHAALHRLLQGWACTHQLLARLPSSRKSARTVRSNVNTAPHLF